MSLVENNQICFSIILVFSGKDCCKGILRPFFSSEFVFPNDSKDLKPVFVHIFK